jgi:hypothetical protein
MIGWKGNIPSETMQKFFQANWAQNQVGVVILISKKAAFKTKLTRGNKGGHPILIKGTIHQEATTTVNKYTPNISTHFHKRNNTGHKSTDKPQHNKSGWL